MGAPLTERVKLVNPQAGLAFDVEGELNKVAANIGLGRNHAGVHWRTDDVNSLYLGEAIAISILRDQRRCYNEVFGGVHLHQVRWNDDNGVAFRSERRSRRSLARRAPCPCAWTRTGHFSRQHERLKPFS
jgi:hypothetical protein